MEASGLLFDPVPGVVNNDADFLTVGGGVQWGVKIRSDFEARLVNVTLQEDISVKLE